MNLDYRVEPKRHKIRESYTCLTRGCRQGAEDHADHGKKPADHTRDFCREVIAGAFSYNILNHGNLISPQFPLLLMIDIIVCGLCE